MTFSMPKALGGAFCVHDGDEYLRGMERAGGVEVAGENGFDPVAGKKLANHLCGVIVLEAGWLSFSGFASDRKGCR